MNNEFNNSGNEFNQNIENPQPIDIPLPDLNAPMPEPVNNPVPEVNEPAPMPIDIPLPDLNAPAPEPVSNPLPDVSEPAPQPIDIPLPGMDTESSEPVDNAPIDLNPEPMVNTMPGIETPNPEAIPNSNFNMDDSNPKAIPNPMPGFGAPVDSVSFNETPNSKPRSNKTLIIAGAIVLVLVIVGVLLAVVFLGGGKKVVCSITDNISDVSITMKSTMVQKREYIDSYTEIVFFKKSGFTKEEIEKYKETYADSDMGDDFKFETNKEKVTLSFKNKETDVALEDLKETFIEEGGSCK